MQLARQAAGVARVGEDPRDQPLVLRDRLPVLAGLRGAGIAPGQEAGPRGRAERVLAEGVLEEDAAGGQAVDPGRPHPGVAVAAQRVEPLLVGADPEDVRSLHRADPSLMRAWAAPRPAENIRGRPLRAGGETAAGAGHRPESDHWKRARRNSSDRRTTWPLRSLCCRVGGRSVTLRSTGTRDEHPPRPGPAILVKGGVVGLRVVEPLQQFVRPQEGESPARRLRPDTSPCSFPGSSGGGTSDDAGAHPAPRVPGFPGTPRRGGPSAPGSSRRSRRRGRGAGGHSPCRGSGRNTPGRPRTRCRRPRRVISRWSNPGPCAGFEAPGKRPGRGWSSRTPAVPCGLPGDTRVTLPW